MKPLSRRSVTTGLAAAVTTIPAMGLGVGASKDGSKLQELITAHRAAYEAFCKAIDREQKMDVAWDKANADRDKTIVPCLVGGGFSASQGYGFCAEHLAGVYTRQRDNLKQTARIAPELAEQLRAVIDAKEEENVALLNRVFADEEARKEAFGLAGAERDLDATDAAESETFSAICSYRCRTPEDAKLKAKYLLTTSAVKDTWEEDAKALLKSFVDKAGD